MNNCRRLLSWLLVSILFSAALPAADVERRELGNLRIEGIPEIPTELVGRRQQYQNTRAASIEDWDADGKGMIISTRFGETTQLHHVARPGGARRQLTFFTEPVTSASVNPDPARPGFIFPKDVGGGEAYQLFHFDLKTAQHSLLTDGTSRNGFPRWSSGGEHFAYYSTARNGRDFDVLVGSVEAPGKAKRILEKGGAWVPVDWSPDDAHLLVLNYVSAGESYYHVLDIASGKLKQINPSSERIAYGGALWARDGKGIYITSNEGSEFLRLKYHDLASGSFTDLTADIPWNIGQLELSPAGDRLAFTANEGGISRLYLLDTARGKYEAVGDIPVGQIASLRFAPDGKRLAMVISTAQTPGDVFVLQLAGGSLVRWTESEVGGLDTSAFAMPELIHYETFDEVDGVPRQVPAFYYKPEGKGPHPVVISIHGGPEAQFTPSFSSTVAFYVNDLGVAVIAPNVRGSSGYGKTYLDLDNGFAREDSVRDIGKLLDWIGSRPELDASRVAVTGGSYGGYMVLASMVNFGDRLRCGIDVVGISNFVTFLENTEEYRRDLRRVEYGDERNAEMRQYLLAISPTTNADKINKPMFIAQGLNDPRVPVGESEQIAAAIRKQGGSVWYLMATDEGHGFRKKTNRDYYQNAVALFLERYLLR